MQVTWPASGWNVSVPHGVQTGFCGGSEAPEQTPVRRVPAGQALARVQLVHTRVVEAVGGVLWYCQAKHGSEILQLVLPASSWKPPTSAQLLHRGLLLSEQVPFKN